MARHVREDSTQQTMRIVVSSMFVALGLMLALWLNGSFFIGRYSIDISGTPKAIGLALSAILLLVGLYGLSRTVRG